MMGKSGDPYAKLARYYDDENADLIEDLPAYLALAERFGGPVLDVGCGTGRVSFYLAGNGLRVVGIDSSEEMLQRAQERAGQHASASSRITWQRADVRQMAPGERFGLAIYAYNGFMHLIEQSQQIAALERMAAHLEPGGGLAIDIPNPVSMFLSDDVPGLVLERTFTDGQSGQVVMQQSLARVDRATQVMSVTWVYDRIGPDGLVHRDVIPLRLRYTMGAEMRLLLERAGLRGVELYGNYDFSPYGEDSARLFVVATRAEGEV
jgi:trans-aconitate methyltransferase